LPRHLRDLGQGQRHSNVARMITHRVGAELLNGSPLFDLIGFVHQTSFLDAVNCPDPIKGLGVERRRLQFSDFGELPNILSACPTMPMGGLPVVPPCGV